VIIARSNDDGLASSYFVRAQVAFLSATPYSDLARQRIDKFLDRAPPAANRVTFD
jgi:hypothetical protein